MKIIWENLRIFWSLVRNVGFMFFLLLLAYLVLTVPDQADDFICSFIEGFDIIYYSTVCIFLICWSYITWYSSSIILDITPTNEADIGKINTEKFNRFMAYLPFVIMALVFFQSIGDVHNKWTAFIIGCASLLIGFFVLRHLQKLDAKNDDLKNNNVSSGKWPSSGAIVNHKNRPKGKIFVPPTFLEELEFIRKYPNVLFYFRTLGIAAITLLILFCIPQILIPVSTFLRPAAVLLLSICFLTYVITVLFYFHDIEVRPFVLVIAICFTVFSFWNDNTGIPVMDRVNDFRLTPKEAFAKWYEARKDKWKSCDTMPVIFIATQGGGIRGELWTIECIRKLCDTFPEFKNQIFCMGGASGGTVGAVYQTAYWFDKEKNPLNTSLTDSALFEFAGTDCISPVTASFAFGENLQHFLPFPICFLERSKIMMKAFSRAYKCNLNSAIVDQGMLKLYYPDYKKENFNVNIPSLFINGVMAETGQRIITSNLKTAKLNNFNADIDFFDCIKADISMATASLNCMRFPLLLSGGLFYKDSACNKVGHVADGGYRENTGLQAMYSLMCELYEMMKEYKVKPIVIYIRNGNAELKNKDSSPIRLMHELRTPFTALLNVNGTSLPAVGIMKMFEQQKTCGNPMNMVTHDLWLNNESFKSEATFPLGLYMSDNAKHYLKIRADEISKYDIDLLSDLNLYFNQQHPDSISVDSTISKRIVNPCK